jgi:hypothetical protein
MVIIIIVIIVIVIIIIVIMLIVIVRIQIVVIMIISTASTLIPSLTFSPLASTSILHSQRDISDTVGAS